MSQSFLVQIFALKHLHLQEFAGFHWFVKPSLDKLIASHPTYAETCCKGILGWQSKQVREMNRTRRHSASQNKGGSPYLTIPLTHKLIKRFLGAL